MKGPSIPAFPVLELSSGTGNGRTCVVYTKGFPRFEAHFTVAD